MNFDNIIIKNVIIFIKKVYKHVQKFLEYILM